MNCTEAREEFSALLDGELTPETRSAVESHLSQCADCLRELDGIKRIDGMYRQLPPHPAPADFEERVHEAIRPAAIRFDRAARRATAVRIWPLLAAAAVLLVILGGTLLRIGTRPTEFNIARNTAAPAPSAPATRLDLEKRKEAEEQLKAVGYMGVEGKGAAAQPALKPEAQPVSQEAQSPVVSERKPEAEPTTLAKTSVVSEVGAAAARTRDGEKVTGMSKDKKKTSRAPAAGEPYLRKQQETPIPAAPKPMIAAARPAPPAEIANARERATAEEIPVSANKPAAPGLPHSDSVPGSAPTQPSSYDTAQGGLQNVVVGGSIKVRGNYATPEPAAPALARAAPMPAPPPALAKARPAPLPQPAPLNEDLAATKANVRKGAKEMEGVAPVQEEVADKRQAAAETRRSVAGRIFELRDGVWRQENYHGESTTLLVRGSDELRRLTARYGRLSRILDLGDRVIFSFEKKWYKVEPPASETSPRPPDSPNR